MSVDFGGTFNADGTWKLPAIQQFLQDRENPVVWIDDELEGDAFQWAASRPHTHSLHADPARGLMDDGLRTEAERLIRAYANEEPGQA